MWIAALQDRDLAKSLVPGRIRIDTTAGYSARTCGKRVDSRRRLAGFHENRTRKGDRLIPNTDNRHERLVGGRDRQGLLGDADDLLVGGIGDVCGNGAILE